MDNYYDAVSYACKVKKDNSLYITAEGLAMSCCWTAGRMYKWWLEDPNKRTNMGFYLRDKKS